jgi:hypothetical protein
MSTLKVDAIRHNSATSDAITTAADGTCTARITGMTGGDGLSNRNVVINGGMMVSQRSTSASYTSGQAFPALDRFKMIGNSGMTVNTTISQTADNPDGLGYCLKVLANAAQTPSGSENFLVRYAIEEQDVKRFGYGTSSCKEVTISFSVKSNKTGTYSLQVYLGNYVPNIITTYTINSANTWEFKSITLPTYTTSYTHLGDTERGFLMDWHLSDGPDDIVSTTGWQTAAGNARAATGQVNLLDTVNNYWQLTNVQVESGNTATSFEHRNFGDELNRCQRYYQQFEGISDQGALGFGRSNSTTVAEFNVPLSVPLRASPTLNACSWAVFTATNQTNSGSQTPTVRRWRATNNMLACAISGLSGMTNARTLSVYLNGGDTFTMDAEVPA